MLEIMGVVSQRVGDGTSKRGGALMLAEPMEFLILLDGSEELMDARLIVDSNRCPRGATRGPRLSRWRRSRIARQNGSDGEVVEDDLRFHRTIFLGGEPRCSPMLIVHESPHKLMEITSQMVDLNTRFSTVSAHLQRHRKVTRRCAPACSRT
jgi:hypothetical protein